MREVLEERDVAVRELYWLEAGNIPAVEFDRVKGDRRDEMLKVRIG